MPNESTTLSTFLMHSTDGTAYTKLVDIKDYPDLGGDPDTVDISTLTDWVQRNLLGRQSLDNLSFLANYTPDDYQKCVALQGAVGKFALWFDSAEGAPAGSLGKFQWDGQITTKINGGSGVAAREMTITIAVSTKITPVFA